MGTKTMMVLVMVVVLSLSMSIDAFSLSDMFPMQLYDMAKVKPEEDLEVTVNHGECSDIVPLGECTEDQASHYPSDGQAVYLGSTWGEGWWRYPSWDKWVRHSQHDIHSIINTEYSWAKWIWHNCTGDYVCLESGKYPGYYLFRTPIIGHKVGYSAAPEHAKWAWQRIDTQRNTSRGIYMYLISQRWYENKDYEGIPIFVYIPPRCEGYRKVLDYANKRSKPIDVTYTYESGVSHMIAPHSGKDIALSIIQEVITSIIEVALRGVFSFTWTEENITTYYETKTITTKATVDPNTHLVIWQKAASYGPYEWQSGVYFVSCTYSD